MWSQTNRNFVLELKTSQVQSHPRAPESERPVQGPPGNSNASWPLRTIGFGACGRVKGVLLTGERQEKAGLQGLLWLTPGRAWGGATGPRGLGRSKGMESGGVGGKLADNGTGSLWVKVNTLTPLTVGFKFWDICVCFYSAGTWILLRNTHFFSFSFFCIYMKQWMLEKRIVAVISRYTLSEIMLYTLNSYSAVCQLCLHKTGKYFKKCWKGRWACSKCTQQDLSSSRARNGFSEVENFSRALKDAFVGQKRRRREWVRALLGRPGGGGCGGWAGTVLEDPQVLGMGFGLDLKGSMKL